MRAMLYPKILIISKDTNAAKELTSLFQATGMHTARAGERTLRTQIRSIVPNAVVVEEKTAPGGWLISYQIRQRSNVPIILLGYTEREMAWVKAAAYGIDHYMVIPFNPLELVARVRALIRRHENLWYKLH